MYTPALGGILLRFWRSKSVCAAMMSKSVLLLAFQLQPAFAGQNSPENLTEDHPWCSLPVSQRVRSHVDGAIKDILDKLPEKCPFHPQRDLLAQGNQQSSGQSVCLADYCDIFGACADPLDVPCDASKLQQQKNRCEKLLLQCFPPGAADQQIRRWHSHYSRKWCKELDCDVRNHREEEELRALTKISPLLAMISFMCLAAFAVMLLLIGGTDDLIFFIYECGFIPHSLMRSWVNTRDGLRKYAGLPISHIS